MLSLSMIIIWKAFLEGLSSSIESLGSNSFSSIESLGSNSFLTIIVFACIPRGLSTIANQIRDFGLFDISNTITIYLL